MNNWCCNQKTSLSYLIQKFIIKQLSGVFRLGDNTTRLSKIWEKLLSTVLENGKVGVINLAGKDFVCQLANTYLDINGDIVKSDGYISNYKANNKIYVSLDIFQPIYFNLLNSVPLMTEFYYLLKTLDDSWDSIEVDINNSRIKFYYMPPAEFDDEQIKAHIDVKMDINNIGIAIVNNKIVYQQLTKDEDGNNKLTELSKEKLRLLNQNGLKSNEVESNANNVWTNFRNVMSTLFMFTGVRHEFSAKAAQMNVPETINVTSIFDIMENLWYERVVNFVNNWNLKTGEKNVVIRRRINEDSAEETHICSTPKCET